MHRRIGIAVGIVVLVVVAWYASPHSLRGSILSNAEIEQHLKARADADGNGSLTAREIRKELTKIIRDVILQKPSADINGDGTTDKQDIAATTRGFKALLSAVCGNGVIDAGESCDDQNTNPGDGCSATCVLETGFVCSGTPTSCRRIVCGDGKVEGSEQCDDGNTVAVDGCDATCSPDPGFTCQGEPTACSLKTDEPVATVTMLGMAPSSTLPAGNPRYSLVMAFSVKAWGHTPIRLSALPLSLLAGSYANGPNIDVFDDIAMSGKVGSSGYETGNPDQRYLLIDQAPSRINPGETKTFYVGAILQPRSTPLEYRLGFRSDVGAGANYSSYFIDTTRSLVVGGVKRDGSCQSAPCVVSVITSPTTHWTIESICGDGRVTGAEQCDDGLKVSGDGCSATCEIEEDFGCSGEPSQCSPLSPVCGNGRVQVGEACDDGDTDAGDGCSSACLVEAEYRCTGTRPTVCVSYFDYVKDLADTNDNGTVSDNEALIFLLDIADAPDKPYAEVSKFDIVLNNAVDDADIAKALSIFDMLFPS